MDKRTIRVLVVDRAGADYRLIQKSLTQCGVLRYVVERAGNLSEGLEMLADGRYDCCFVDAETIAGSELAPAAASTVTQRPIVFVLNDQGAFTPPASLAALEATRMARKNMTVPHLLLAIRQAVRANAIARTTPSGKSLVKGFLSSALRPAFPM